MKQIFNIYRTTQGIPFYNLSKSITFPQDQSLQIYKYFYSDEDIPWTILSYKIYGTIDYWWILSALNKDYPFYAPRQGVIKVIDPLYIGELLTYINNHGGY